MKEKHYHVAGWWMFVVCAILFIISATKAGDIWALTGSIVFFVACFVFMVPLKG